MSWDHHSAEGRDRAERLEVLDDRSQRHRGEELQAAEDQDHPDQEADEEAAVGWQGAGGGGELGLGGFSSPCNFRFNSRRDKSPLSFNAVITWTSRSG